jgi:glycosyltransferase involved in cell wall biosynthesis
MSIAVLIATRNRPEKLTLLLESLIPSAHFIRQIIIVSSGQDLTKDLSNFMKYLPIKHVHMKVSGQIAQKIEGIKHIENQISWVLFLDDDLIITRESIETLIVGYLKNPKFKEVWGFGLRIRNLEYKMRSNVTNYFLSILGLYSSKPGLVLKSGHAQNYQNSKSDIETEWLNGISIWRFDSLTKYGSGFPEINYAAYEDVIFSYKVSRVARLMFAFNVNVVNQGKEKNIPLTVTQFKAGSYMRYLFVSENENLSKLRFLLAHFFRSFDFIINGDSNILGFTRFRISFLIMLDLCLAVAVKTDPIKLLKRKYY